MASQPITTAEQAVAVLLGLRSRHRARGQVAAAEVLQRAITAVRAQMNPQPAAAAATTRKETP